MMLARPLSIVLLLWLSFSAWLAPAALAQSGSPSPSASATPASLEELQVRLAGVEATLQTAPTPGVSESLESPDEPPAIYTSLLRLETALRRLISLRESGALLDAQTRQVEVETEELSLNGLPEKPPYPISLLDQFQVELAEADDELQSQQAALLSAKADVRGQENALKDRQAQRRRLLDKAQSGDGNAADDRANDSAAWAVKAAETALELAEAEAGLVEKSVELAQKRRDLLHRKVGIVAETFQFTQPMLQEQLSLLEEKRRELNVSLDEATGQAEQALVKVKALPTGQGDQASAAQAAAETEWLTTYQRRKILLEQALELNLAQRDLWERRYELSRGQALNNLSDWEESTRTLLGRLRTSRKTLDSQLNQVRSRMAGVLEAAPEGDDQTQDWVNRQARALAAHQTALEAALADTDQTEKLAQRLLGELRGKRSDLTWTERFRRGWGVVVDIWRIELYTIGDNSVTVGKVLLALLVLVVGLTLAGRTTRFFSSRLLQRLPMPDQVRASIERVVRYFVILLVFLFALRVVNIPLTIFTFLGGTMAIAIGFGAQNILNNFISGLILMVERPVRVGDMIEVEQTTGVIEEIGARSTRVRVGTGIHVVLPNSVLLENRVINWTLTDQMVRTSVSVGVGYGSDNAQVMNLMARAAMSLDTVEKTPPPFVVCENFADSSITFTIHFWVSLVDPMNKRLTESAMRLAIDALFREHSVSIPFPQRDLNIGQPVSVRLLTDPDKETPPTSP